MRRPDTSSTSRRTGPDRATTYWIVHAARVGLGATASVAGRITGGLLPGFDSAVAATLGWSKPPMRAKRPPAYTEPWLTARAKIRSLAVGFQGGRVGARGVARGEGVPLLSPDVDNPAPGVNGAPADRERVDIIVRIRTPGRGSAAGRIERGNVVARPTADVAELAAGV